MPAASMLNALTHGWSGLGVAYATVAAPMLAGMMRAHTRVSELLLTPLLAAPVTALAGIGMGLAGPALDGLGLVSSGLPHLAVGAAMSAGLGYAAGRVFGRHGVAATSHQRGTLIAPARAAGGATPADAGRALRPAHARPLTLAGLPVATADEGKHFKIIGTTGTGKSTAIAELVAGALERGDRAVIADPDGGYLRRFYDAKRGDLILNPFDQRSVKWDLFAEIRQGYDVEQLARSLLPDRDGTDRSWRGYARTFFTAVTRQAHAAGVRDVAELYRLLVIADTKELRTLTGGTPAQPFLDEHNGRMFDSIRSVTSSAVGALEYIAAQQAPALSLREWVGRERGARGGVLFIPYRAGQIAALSSAVSAWMRIATFEAMDRPEGDQRLWFVVDELDALGPIDGLKDALARVRKFGGRWILGLQSIAQVASTYGEGEAHTIVENCGNTLILRCSASEGGGTSRFASTLIGQREVRRTSVSQSRRWGELFGATTRAEHLSIEPAVLASEIEQLADLRGYLKFASRPQWLDVRLQPPDALHAPDRTAPVVPVVAKAAAEQRAAAPVAAAAVDAAPVQAARTRKRARSAPAPAAPSPSPSPAAGHTGTSAARRVTALSSTRRVRARSSAAPARQEGHEP
jgi:hypothetical protein